MSALSYDLDFVQGERAVLAVELQNLDGAPMDLAGMAFAFVVREEVDSTDALIELATDATNTGGDITVDLAVAVVTVTLDADTTAALPPSRWALWSDPADADADALVWGDVKPGRVARP